MSVIALFYMAVTPSLVKRYSVTGCYYAWLILVIGLIIPFRPQFGSSIVKVTVPGNTAAPVLQSRNRAPVAISTLAKGVVSTSAPMRCLPAEAIGCLFVLIHRQMLLGQTLFDFIKENRRLFKNVMENAGTLRLGETYDKMFSYVFTPILGRFQVPAQDRKYIMAFYIHGIIAIAKEWIKQDCSDSVENIIFLIRQCVMQKFKNKE